MLEFKKYFVNKIITDPTMQGFLAHTTTSGTIYNVFPSGVDIQPENFPAITYKDAGFAVLSRPQGMHIGIFQVDIWSILNALEVERMYTRLTQLLNFRDSTQDTTVGTLWWIRENGMRDMSEPSRRLWRKVVDFKVWYNNTDNL